MACEHRSAHYGHSLPHVFTSTFRVRRPAPSRELDLIELGWRAAVAITGPADTKLWTTTVRCSWCGEVRRKPPSGR